jgi:hypothetical protein
MLGGSRRVWALFLVGAAIAYVVLLQPPGCNQTAHYSLVESLARGTPRIDRFHDQTCDTAYVGGHYFAAKAPGLALATLPVFEVLRLARAVPENALLHAGFPSAMLGLPRRALWQVGLFGSVLPALGLLVLMGAVAERIAPRTGLPVAAAFGLGTLILPFATVFFAHVLAAFLAFAAFAMLFLWRRPGIAGCLAGLAVCVDLPLALVAAALALYAGRRVLPFIVGALAGVLPLLAFNTWAFSNPFRLSYANAVLSPGKSGHDVLGANSAGFFGIGVPSLRAGAELLFSPRGLFTLSPLLLVAFAGLWLLPRRGFRREAILAGGVFLVFLVYNSGYYVPFGGYVPGPRFLIATIPFLALGLPAALQEWPLVTTVAAAFSIGAMTVATAAEPLLGNDDTHSWIVRWQHGDFAQSVVTLAHGGHGWLALSPFLAGLAVAIAAATSALPRPQFTVRGLAALGALGVLFLAAPDLLRTDRAVGQNTGLLALCGLLLVLIVLALRSDLGFLVAGIPLAALAVPRFASHTKQALVVVLISLIGVAALEWRRRQPVTRRTSA